SGAGGQADLFGIAGWVLVDSQQAGHVAALRELRADEVPGALGGDHEHVDRGRRDNLAEMDVEPVAEGQIRALLDVRADLGAVQAGLHLVRRQDHDDVGPLDRIRRAQHFEPGWLRLLPGRSLPQADEHVHAAVLQVQRMGVALAAEPDDRNGLPLQDLQIGVLIVVDLQHVWVPSLCRGTACCAPTERMIYFSSFRMRLGCAAAWRAGSRAIAMRPVRTSSLMPSGWSRLMHASTFLTSPVISIV